MRSLLQQLENNEAILMMYLADELDPQDRHEVEQLLAADKGLADQLQQMQADQFVASAFLSTADGPAAADSSASQRRLRQVSRLINHWNVERLARPAQVPQHRRVAMPWWSYPVAAAAVLCLVLCWWGMTSDNPILSGGNSVATTQNSNDSNDGQPPKQYVIDTVPYTVPPHTVPVERIIPGEEPVQESISSETDAQASALRNSSDNSALTSSIFMTDNND